VIIRCKHDIVKEKQRYAEIDQFHKGEQQHMISTSARNYFGGQNDVQPALHVPMVYESVAARPVQWEYRIVSVDPSEEALPDTAFLNELGNQGWLLVGVLDSHQSRLSYYFVRQKEA
jgi:hypothetical protein